MDFGLGWVELAVIMIMVFIIPVIAVIVCIFLLALRIVRGSPSRKDRQAEVEESGLIQEVYHGLMKMEERIEVLETLLLDREKRGDKQ